MNQVPVQRGPLFLELIKTYVLTTLVAAYVLSVVRLEAGTELWVWWAAASLISFLAGFGWRLHHQLEIRRTLKALRALDPIRQAQIIDNMWASYARFFWRQQLASEDTPDTGGVVERYPFSRADLRENSIMHWSLTALALSAISAVFLPVRLHSALQLALIVAALGIMCVVASLRRRDRVLRTVLELTAFGITRIAEDGSRTHISWNQSLLLRNVPTRSRVELVSADGTAIPIEYGRLGFARLLERVWELGGFSMDGPTVEKPASAPRQAPVSAPASGSRQSSPARAVGATSTTAARIVAMLAGVATAHLTTRPAPAEAGLATFSPRPDEVRRGRWIYETEVVGSRWRSPAGRRTLSVTPCPHRAIPAWCVRDGSSSIVMARQDLRPLVFAGDTAMGSVYAHFDSDSVRSEVRARLADGRHRDAKRFVASRWHDAVGHPAALHALLPTVEAVPGWRAAVRLQPLVPGERPHVRRLPGEPRSYVTTLRQHIAIASFVRRDSGHIELDGPDSATVGPVLPYRASVIDVRLPDRLMTYWIADSSRIVVRREQRIPEANWRLVERLVRIEPF